MLAFNPDERPTISQLNSYDWVKVAENQKRIYSDLFSEVSYEEEQAI